MDAQELDNKLQDLKKKLDDLFTDEIKVLGADALKEKVVQLSKQVEEVEQEKAKDGKLKQLRSDKSDLEGGYRDKKKLIDRQRQYVLLTLQERGNL